MNRVVLLLALVAFSLLSGTGSLLAAEAQPPTPPPSPVCGYCSGPPPPPTLVPTATKSIVGQLTPAVHRVVLSSNRVHRNHFIRANVTAPRGETLLFSLTYWQRKQAVSSKGVLDHAPPYVKTLKIPWWAPVGKATLKVSFRTSDNATSAQQIAVQFMVLK